MQETQHENAGEWPEAEEIYKQILTLTRAQNNPMALYKAYDDLSALYSLLGRDELALENAQAAIESAHLEGIDILSGMALERLTRCWLQLVNVAQALQTANERVQLLSAENGDSLSLARALVSRARCYVESNHIAEAQQDLDTSLPLLTKFSRARLFAGVQSGLANWWATTA